MHPIEDQEEVEQKKKDRILSIQAKVQSVVAPKLAEEALSEAVLSAPVSTESDGMGVSIT